VFPLRVGEDDIMYDGMFPLRVGEDDIMYDGKARLELCNLQSDSSLIREMNLSGRQASKKSRWCRKPSPDIRCRMYILQRARK
jgi:hypothetical protein